MITGEISLESWIYGDNFERWGIVDDVHWPCDCEWVFAADENLWESYLV
jgi:hypothetical protein